MHNFKRVVKVAAVLVVVLLVFGALDFVLYPCTFTRNDVHAVITEKHDDIYMGTSHGKMGIDPEIMEAVSGRTGHNLCVGGQYSEDAYYLTKLMIEEGTQPSRLIYEVSPGYFTSQKEEGNNYLLFYHEFPVSKSKLEYFIDSVMDCNFRTMFFPWYEYELGYELEHLRDTVSKRWNKDFGNEDLESETQKYHESGFVERYPVDPATFTMDGIAEFTRDQVKTRNMEYLEKLIQLCKAHEIEFVALVTPMPEETLHVYEASFADAYQYFEEFFEKQEVRYINFNSGQYYPAFTHHVTAFTDYDGHLHGDAARDFSGILAQVLDETYVFPTIEPEMVVVG